MRVQTHATRQSLTDVALGRSGHDEENRDQAQNGKSGELRRARHEVDSVESAPIRGRPTGSDPIERC